MNDSFAGFVRVIANGVWVKPQTWYSEWPASAERQPFELCDSYECLGFWKCLLSFEKDTFHYLEHDGRRVGRAVKMVRLLLRSLDQEWASTGQKRGPVRHWNPMDVALLRIA